MVLTTNQNVHPKLFCIANVLFIYFYFFVPKLVEKAAAKTGKIPIKF